MTKLSESVAGQAWLGQFTGDDALVAEQLIDQMLLVGADELRTGLKSLLDQVRERVGDNPIALYAEREVPDDQGEILPMFGRPGDRRATGYGPAPVVFNPAEPEVGSEGPFAGFITGYQRQHSAHILNHPGPDLLRDRRARAIVILTDFIGSGSRVCEMLDAFQAVRTVRSWHSYHLIEFFVVAYSGTEPGLARVKAHRTKPSVLTVMGCPTVNEAFRGAERDAINRLCRAYPAGFFFPFGFGDTGALIAFEHGIPDNAPALLHSDHGGWNPLFPNRSASVLSVDFPASNREQVAARAVLLLRMRDAQRYLADSRGTRWVQTMLVLAAIAEGARTPTTISARTRISIQTVGEMLGFARLAGWTGPAHALTELGLAELRNLRRRRATRPILPRSRKMSYYPTQLRAR